jgi:hypothetical protein
MAARQGLLFTAKYVTDLLMNDDDIAMGQTLV